MALLPPDHTHIIWTMVSSWYFGSPHPFYFDMLCQDYKRRRFQITLKPDLSTASLHAINSSECLPPNNSSTLFRGSTYCQHSRICEDTLVSFWRYDEHYCGLYTGLTSDRFSNVISRCGPAAQMLLPDFGCEYILYPCPASGRFVRLDARNGVAVLDFFWYILIICHGHRSSDTHLIDAADLTNCFFNDLLYRNSSNSSTSIMRITTLKMATIITDKNDQREFSKLMPVGMSNLLSNILTTISLVCRILVGLPECPFS